MSNPEFTPGQWSVEHEVNRYCDHVFWVNAPDGSTPAKCYTPYNAYLVSASPDMYEILKLYEEFEGTLLMEAGAWSTDNGLPKLTQKLLDKWIEIQGKRNKCLAKTEGEITNG